jgi:hypothetical protein
MPIMALRIKSHWHDDDAERSMEEIAGALAFITWRIATDKAIALHGERFVYESDRQRLAVIIEYLYFQIQIVDRMVYGMLSEEQRRALIVQLALKLAGHVQDNSQDLFGRGDYGKPFITGLNRRNADYAPLAFDQEEGPSYPFLRHLGFEIQQVMGEREENRWVIDQVMDKDGWEVYKQLSRAVRDLIDW